MLVDKVYEIIFAVFVAVFIPLLLFGIKSDQTVQAYAADAVEEFINKSCATGIINSVQYEELVSRLDATGVVYDVYLVHSNKKVSPQVNEDGTVELDSTITFYEEYRNKEIFDLLFAEDGSTSQYYLNQGDYLKLVINNRTKTFGERMASMFFRGSEGKTILVSRGGYVGNEVDY